MKDRCVESRERQDGTRVRRYVTPDGRRYSTVELPLEMWQTVKARSGATNGLEVALARKYLEAVPRLLSDELGRAIALDFGVSLRTVVRWRKRARTEAAKGTARKPKTPPPRQLALQDVWLQR